MDADILNCYRINYDVKFWMDRAEQTQQHLCGPVGAVLAVNALCDEVEKLQKQRDELLAALELLVAGIENSVSDTFIPLRKARAALAKVGADATT